MIRPLSCPICKKVLPANSATALATFPFCSVRCREVDLYRWSVGKYAIVETVDPGEIELTDAEFDDSDLSESDSSFDDDD